MDPLHQIGDIGRPIHRGLNDGKFVAAKPRNDVGFPQTASQALRHGLQQFVAALMSERVVDALEFVEVQIEHRELLAAPDALQRLLELLAEEQPVGQVSQRVVVRQMRDPLLRKLAVGDVLDHAQQILRLSRAVANDHLLRRDVAPAIAAQCNEYSSKELVAVGLQQLVVVPGNHIGGFFRKDFVCGVSDDLVSAERQSARRPLG